MFSENTYNVLLTQSGKSADENDAAIFMNKVLIWGQILHVKTLQIDKLHNTPWWGAEIRSPTDSQLDFITEFGQMALNMGYSQGYPIT